jgi:polysaccharide deacetylase family protein (PEP-CTERM system associated)
VQGIKIASAIERTSEIQMINAATIDLEDYYQVTAFASNGGAPKWDSHASRIEYSTAKLLDILDIAKQKATFFTLGWAAGKYPKLIRQIAARGHEIACHSNMHRLVHSMTPAEFRVDTLEAKRLLEQASETPVLGYRAPSFSITPSSLWAFEVLAELGFTYDSSIFPIKHANYGMPRAPRFPFKLVTDNGSIVEFPMPTLQIGGTRAPLGGGAYLRLLPYWFTRWGIRFINEKEDRPACVYLHPWELDSEQPRMSGSMSARLRHYFGLQGTEVKFRNLLLDFEFQPLRFLIDELKRTPSNSAAARLPELSLVEFGRSLADN